MPNELLTREEYEARYGPIGAQVPPAAAQQEAPDPNGMLTREQYEAEHGPINPNPVNGTTSPVQPINADDQVQAWLQEVGAPNPATYGEDVWGARDALEDWQTEQFPGQEPLTTFELWRRENPEAAAAYISELSENANPTGQIYENEGQYFRPGSIFNYLREGFNTLTFGFGDEIAGAVAGIGAGIGNIFDGDDQTFAEAWDDAYTNTRDYERLQQDLFREHNRSGSLLASVLGGVPSMLIPGGLAFQALKPASLAGRLSVGAGVGATGAVAQGVGESEETNPFDRFREAANPTNLGVGAVAGTAGAGIASAFRRVPNSASQPSRVTPTYHMPVEAPAMNATDMFRRNNGNIRVGPQTFDSLTAEGNARRAFVRDNNFEILDKDASDLSNTVQNSFRINAGTATPRTNDYLNEVQALGLRLQTTGQNATFQDIADVRSRIMTALRTSDNAANALTPEDRVALNGLRRELDDWIDGYVQNNPSRANVIAEWRAGNDALSRAYRVQDLQEIQTQAQSAAAAGQNYGNELHSRLQRLTNSSGFSEWPADMQAAVNDLLSEPANMIAPHRVMRTIGLLGAIGASTALHAPQAMIPYALYRAGRTVFPSGNRTPRYDDMPAGFENLLGYTAGGAGYIPPATLAARRQNIVGAGAGAGGVLGAEVNNW